MRLSRLQDVVVVDVGSCTQANQLERQGDLSHRKRNLQWTRLSLPLKSQIYGHRVGEAVDQVCSNSFFSGKT